MRLLDSAYLPLYRQRQSFTLQKHIDHLHRLQPTLDLGAFLAVSAIYSSRIEGNPMGLTDYYHWQEIGLPKAKAIQEIDDLIHAYNLCPKWPDNRSQIIDSA